MTPAEVTLQEMDIVEDLGYISNVVLGVIRMQSWIQI
jgi:hypothetical protein